MENRIRFFGHATLELSIDGVTLLTDPVLRPRIAHLRHHHAHLLGGVRAPDVVLISHIHQDHLDLPSLQKFGRGVRLLVPRGAGPLLQRRGFTSVEELSVGASVRHGAVQVHAVPARHTGRRPPFGPTAECIGFVVRGSHSIYFAGDTDIFQAMARIGPVDVALLPVWGWGASIGAGHMNPLRAAQALTLVRPAIAIPIHWGALFPLGPSGSRERVLTEPPLRFAGHARRLAPPVRIEVLRPGESLNLPAAPHPC